MDFAYVITMILLNIFTFIVVPVAFIFILIRVSRIKINKINKKYLIALGLISIIILMVFLTRSEKYIVFHLATAIPTDLTELYVVEKPSVYSAETDTILEDIELSRDEKNELTKLINTIEVTEDPVKVPSSLKKIANQTLYDTSQFRVRFSLYQSKNGSYYVQFLSIMNEPFHKLKDNELPEFYLKLLEK